MGKSASKSTQKGVPTIPITMEKKGDAGVFAEIAHEGGKIKRVIRETGERITIKKVFFKLTDVGTSTVKLGKNDMVITFSNGVEYCLDGLADPDKAYLKFTQFILDCPEEEEEEEEAEEERDYEAELECEYGKVKELEKAKGKIVTEEGKKQKQLQQAMARKEKRVKELELENTYMKKRLDNVVKDLMGSVPAGSPRKWKEAKAAAE